MNQDLNDNEFYEYIDELKAIYAENPQKATEEAKKSLDRLIMKRQPLLKKEDKIKLYLVLYFCVLALFGLINIQGYPLYLIGLMFFAVGIMVGLLKKGYGIIVLFTHLFNLSDKLRYEYIYMFVPLFIFGIVIIMAATLLIYIKTKYGI